MLLWPKTKGSISGQNNMECQWQHSDRTLMEPYYPPETLIGTICKHSIHLNSGLQAGSKWLKNHLGLYSTTSRLSRNFLHCTEKILVAEMACFSKAMELCCVYKPSWCVSVNVQLQVNQQGISIQGKDKICLVVLLKFS